MSQKLDSFSKILLATSAINYMASSINGVNRDMKFIIATPPPNYDASVHKEGIETKDALLEEVVKDLGAIMEKMGNLINGHDCICPIDQYITTPAFQVVIHGNDDVEGDFYDL